MAVNKTPNYSLNKPDKGTRGWDVYLNQNADIIDSELKRLKDKDASQDLRIDNIVAQAGTGNTEIVDARLGADGVSRSTLGTLVREMHSQLIKTNQQSTTIGHGLNIINASQNSPLDIRTEGRTLVNLLGKDGNCEDVSKFTTYQSTAVLDSSNALYGSNAIKITISAGKPLGSIDTCDLLPKMKQGSYYIALADMKNGNTVHAYLVVNAIGDRLGILSSFNTATTYKTLYAKISPTDFDTAIALKIGLVVVGGENQYGYVDGIRLYEITAEEYANIGTVWDDEEIARRYPYVDSVQHVQNPYVIAESENLLPPFTEWTLHANARVKSPYELELNSNEIWQLSSYTLYLKPNQTYTISCDVSNPLYAGFCVDSYDSSNNKTIIFSAVSGTKTFTVPSNSVKIVVYVGSNGAGVNGVYTFTNPILTVGSTAKPFVPRNPSTLFAEVKLGALGYKKDILWKDGQDWKVLKWVEKSETLTITNNTATLANNAQANTAIIVDESTGEIYKRVVALSGSGKEFTQGGSGNKTITFNDGYVPTSPKAHYVLATPVTEVVTDKVEGDLVVNGDTQVEVGSGFTYTEVDGERTYTKLAENQRYNVTANILSVIANYDTLLKSVVDSVVAKQSDLASNQQALIRSVAELYKRVKALGG